MRPGDRLVCAFVDQLPLGQEFKDWPLHVTVIPWFRAELPSIELAGSIKQELHKLTPFEVRIGRETIFGRGKTVNLIPQPTPFDQVEDSVRGLLKNCGAWLVDESTKQKRRYRPHVTAQTHARLHEGDGFWCDHLYIIEQKGDFKIVAAEIAL